MLSKIPLFLKPCEKVACQPGILTSKSVCQSPKQHAVGKPALFNSFLFSSIRPLQRPEPAQARFWEALARPWKAKSRPSEVQARVWEARATPWKALARPGEAPARPKRAQARPEKATARCLGTQSRPWEAKVRP